MAEYRLSQRAVNDLEAIAEFTIGHFGIQQAQRYRDDLKRCFADLAQHPELGRKAEQLAPGLRRLEHGSHVVFYSLEDDGVLVVRVLHYRMNAGSHL